MYLKVLRVLCSGVIVQEDEDENNLVLSTIAAQGPPFPRIPISTKLGK